MWLTFTLVRYFGPGGWNNVIVVISVEMIWRAKGIFFVCLCVQFQDSLIILSHAFIAQMQMGNVRGNWKGDSAVNTASLEVQRIKADAEMPVKPRSLLMSAVMIPHH